MNMDLEGNIPRHREANRVIKTYFREDMRTETDIRMQGSAVAKKPGKEKDRNISDDVSETSVSYKVHREED